MTAENNSPVSYTPVGGSCTNGGGGTGGATAACLAQVPGGAATYYGGGGGGAAGKSGCSGSTALNGGNGFQGVVLVAYVLPVRSPFVPNYVALQLTQR